jgi:hypothetical protein
MELLSTLLARSVFIFELDALNPFGKYNASEAFEALQSRYSFAKTPQGVPEITLEKAAEFVSGRLGEIAIDRLQMYPNGILVDTRSSTKDSEFIADDIIQTARELLGSLVVAERKHFVSQITYRSQMRLEKMNPVLAEIATYIEDSLSDSLKQGFIVDTTGVILNIDNTQARITPAKFTVERRTDVPFVDNIYFSSAPMHSDIHIKFVEKLEASLL